MKVLVAFKTKQGLWAKPYVDPARYKNEAEFVTAEKKRIMASVSHVDEAGLIKSLSDVWKVTHPEKAEKVEKAKE